MAVKKGALEVWLIEAKNITKTIKRKVVKP
jgi:hypothetical protein